MTATSAQTGRLTELHVAVSESSPLTYTRHHVNRRLSLVDGGGFAPAVQGAEERMEAGYRAWRATNPRRRRPARFDDPSSWVPAGYAYFTPRYCAPGTVAFLDLEVTTPSLVRIAYLAVRPDARGHGHARHLIEETYDRHPDAGVHWGRLMHAAMGHLYGAFGRTHPTRTFGGSRYF